MNIFISLRWEGKNTATVVSACHSVFFNKYDLDILTNLAMKKDICITKPDKGVGVVILNSKDYYDKMSNILSDYSEFTLIKDSAFQVIFRVEDKINRSLRTLKQNEKKLVRILIIVYFLLVLV